MMVTVVFPDRETEKRALGFLLGRFSGRVNRTGEHSIPNEALDGLKELGIAFEVKSNDDI